MRLIPHRLDAGLFSQINYVITHIEALGHAEFYVDWTGNTLYQRGNRNLFDDLFEQNCFQDDSTSILDEWPHQAYTGSHADWLYLSDRGWRWDLHRCWQKLRVCQALVDEVDQYCAGWEQTATALHIRNLNIASECPGYQAPMLEDYARIVSRFEGPIFLATDNQEAVTFFRSLLGERLITREIPRAGDMQCEYHLTRRQRVQDVQNCLIDALVMARCDHLIHSVSNIATAVLYMNPAIDHTYVRNPGSVRLKAVPKDDSRFLVQETLRKHEPERVIHVQNVHWADWLLCYPNRVFRRHSVPSAGILDERQDGGLRLNWLEWESECYLPRPILDKRVDSPETRLDFSVVEQREVVINLKDGLANQMFQYAFGLAVARALGAELRVTHVGVGRPFALAHFGIHLARSVPVKDHYIEWNGDYEDGIVTAIMEEIQENEDNSLWIEGYFQNEGFFCPVADEVRQIFTEAIPLPKWVQNCTPVAVHVRLGDYLTLSTHAPLPPSYYHEAMDQMRSHFPHPVFLIFSDEPDECIPFVGTAPDIKILPAMDEYRTMALMQACEAFIISNSIFSWWPAWLSDSTDVICPSRFLPNKDWNNMPGEMEGSIRR